MRKLLLIVPALLILALSLGAALPAAAGPLARITPVAPERDPFSDRYPAAVSLTSPAALQSLNSLRLDIADMRNADGSHRLPAEGQPFEPLVATVYVNDAEAARLAEVGLKAIPIPNESLRSQAEYANTPNAWPTYAQYVTRMQTLASAHPTQVQMVAVGQSLQDRTIWCMKVSDNVTVAENEPEIIYTSSIHGDETTGAEMTMRLAEYLIGNYATLPAVANLVNNMEIWLCPIHNVDGYVAVSRFNANGEDINRDFYDRLAHPTSCLGFETGCEPETILYMNLMTAHRFVMGINYHGGEEVVNYPWDAIPDDANPEYAPDDALFYEFSVGYSSRNPDIWNGGFPSGVTRGWEWYEIDGGLQDFAYVWGNQFHVTIELSSTKRPPFEQMNTFWDHNRDAMLWWLARGLSGLGGRVLDARTAAPLDATVTVAGLTIPNSVKTDAAVGDYHRVIAAGTYNLTASASGYQSQTKSATVVGNTTATTTDFALCPGSFFTVSGVVTDALTSAPLAATLQFVGSPVSAQTTPATGAYTASVCQYNYTLRASAAGYYSQERSINVNGNQTQNFALLHLPDLTPSHKDASAASAQPQELLQYSVVLNNISTGATVNLTDTLPAGLTFTGEMSASQGTPQFSAGRLTWEGPVALGESITVTYGVSVNLCLPAGTEITNQAEIAAGGLSLSRSASITVENLAPLAPVPLGPFDGATATPITQTLSWSAQDPNCDNLAYVVHFGTDNPPTQVVTATGTTAFDPGPLQGHTTYYWSISVSDGISQIEGPVWSFTTLNRLPSASLLTPANGAGDLPLDTVLTWEASDADGDPLTFDVAFGTSPTPTPVVTGTASTTFDPGPLQGGATYYWRITAHDGRGQVYTSVWSFTTQGYRLYLPLMRKDETAR